MKKAELLKQRVEIEEMTEVFTANYPYLVANSNAVGRFARKLGYTYEKQMVNKKLVFFYLKKEAI